MHSSFKPVPQPDYIIPVEIEGRIVDVYVLKRPFVDHFLRAVGSRFEVGARRLQCVWERRLPPHMQPDGRAEGSAPCTCLTPCL